MATARLDTKRSTLPAGERPLSGSRARLLSDNLGSSPPVGRRHSGVSSQMSGDRGRDRAAGHIDGSWSGCRRRAYTVGLAEPQKPKRGLRRSVIPLYPLPYRGDGYFTFPSAPVTPASNPPWADVSRPEVSPPTRPVTVVTTPPPVRPWPRPSRRRSAPLPTWSRRSPRRTVPHQSPPQWPRAPASAISAGRGGGDQSELVHVAAYTFVLYVIGNSEFIG